MSDYFVVNCRTMMKRDLDYFVVVYRKLMDYFGANYNKTFIYMVIYLDIYLTSQTDSQTIFLLI